LATTSRDAQLLSARAGKTTAAMVYRSLLTLSEIGLNYMEELLEKAAVSLFVICYHYSAYTKLSDRQNEKNIENRFLLKISRYINYKLSPG
jgi:hypothetical protein